MRIALPGSVVLNAVLLAGCAHVPSPPAPRWGANRFGEAERYLAMAALDAFGVTEVPVLEVEEVDVAAVNREIEQAEAGDPWTQHPVSVSLRASAQDWVYYTTEIHMIHSSEFEPSLVMVTISALGEPDDSTGGERRRLWLRKQEDGKWLVERALAAVLCRRSGTGFYGLRCP